MKINIIILKYSRLSKEADEVLFIIDFTPNIIIWLNEIVVKRAIVLSRDWFDFIVWNDKSSK